MQQIICIILHMRPLFYNKESHPGCPNLSFIMTTANQSITTMIWLPSQIKNPNCLVEAMLSIVLSPDPKMQAKRKSIQQELDLENGYNILGSGDRTINSITSTKQLWFLICDGNQIILVILRLSVVMIKDMFNGLFIWQTRN